MVERAALWMVGVSWTEVGSRDLEQEWVSSLREGAEQSQTRTTYELIHGQYMFIYSNIYMYMMSKQ